MRRNFTFLLISLGFLVLLSLYHLITFSDNKFHLIFCNVGQGDGILVKTPKGNNIVIDGGPSEYSMTNCLSRHLPFWDRKIDAVFMTHPDSDHLTGLIEIVKAYNIELFATSQAPKDTAVNKELVNQLNNKNIKINYVTKGDRLETEDGMSITIEWPTDAFVASKSQETNDYSIVGLLKFGNATALLTGDVSSVYLNSIMPLVAKESQTTGRILPEIANKNNNGNSIGHTGIFKAPHHGSKTGIDEFTFQHNKPQIAVISAGVGNSYGHPNPEVLQILKDEGIPYTTTMEGDVEFTSDGKKWVMK